ncbi:MAG: EamA family transporter RarD [Wenzhouxiangella sp.]|nr:MAG: EamA family transporter RarD [Wenzhouxiangella sp.]
MAWGLAPVYFKFLGHVGADEIIAHRVLWSVAFLGVVLVLRHGRSLPARLAIAPRTLAVLLLSGSLIVINWLVFIYAVNSDRVLSTSLGYFINPLVTVLFGMLFFRERLAPLQLIGVGIAALGTLYMTVRVGQFPWIALGLALTFALYSVLRKVLDVGPMVGLFWETLLMAPLALLWLVWLSGQGDLAFDPADPGFGLLLAGTGLVTVVPLLLFAAGVRRLPLSTIGIMQYLAPTITFILAVFVYMEPFSIDHAVTFACIWIGLFLFSWAGWVRVRRARIPV